MVKSKKTISVRLEIEYQRTFDELLQSGRFKTKSELVRYLMEVSLCVAGYLERHEMTDTTKVKEVIEDLFAKKQLDLLFANRSK